MNNRGRATSFIDLFLIFVICSAAASCSDSTNARPASKNGPSSAAITSPQQTLDTAQFAKELEAQAEAFSREHKEWQPPGGPASGSAERRSERCVGFSEERAAFFGDLHVHTSFSLDAYNRGGFQTPDDAYRFAKGEPIGLTPLDASGKPTRFGTIDRMLDFAAVTDHAEWIGEVEACRNTESAAYDAMDCRKFRGEVLMPEDEGGVLLNKFVMGGQRQTDGICGADSALCRHYAGSAWRRTQEAAAAHNAPCTFTTFNAWEFSAMPGASKVHRNVILRNEVVPELPISWAEEADAEGLWRKLERRCNDTDTGCEAITIPHNPNLSSGRLFTVTYADRSIEEQRDRAALQARMEPLVEMMQAKGESECRARMFNVIGTEDEYCNFEKVRYTAEGARPEDCEDGIGSGALGRVGCQSRLDFARYGLIEGLREYARLGVNPLRLGLIGSTDTHNGTPGATEEYDYLGHNANQDDTLEERMTLDAYAPHWMRNPGGLIGVWAEENARDALFDAMKRRETFATSGVRIKPRLFAGWDLASDLCDDHAAVSTAYLTGVPMGGELSSSSADKGGPTFFATALRDGGTETFAGTGLQRIQIIKGEVDPSGAFRQTVVNVAEAEPAAVDDQCQATRQGASMLCAVWRDPEFDPETPAVYYARVLEQPSCRWHARQCLEIAPNERPAACDDKNLPRTIQERAWTSPIWYHPLRKTL